MLCKVYTILLAAVLGPLAAATNASATTVTNTNDSGPGSLRQALADTPSNGIIDFALAGCPCNMVLTSGELVISRSVAIQGPGAGLLTISGNKNSRVFRVEIPNSATVILDSLTITSGRIDGSGGGIYVRGYGGLDLLVKNAVIAKNFAANGGGILVEGASLTVSDSTVSDNETRPTLGIGGGFTGRSEPQSQFSGVR